MPSLSAGKISRSLVWFICLLPCLTSAQSLSPNKALGRYQQYVWGDQHGLPQNGVTSVTRTSDGYLWLGTFEGATRFDGVRFTVFDTTNVPAFKAQVVTALHEDRAGNFWLATNGGGLIRRTGETFKVFTTTDGLSNNFVISLAEDKDGSMWIGTEGGGLNHFRGDKFETFTTKNGLPDDYVPSLVVDQNGGLWIGTDHGLAHFEDGRFTNFTVKDGLAAEGVSALCIDHAGTLWVGTVGGGLSRFANGRFVDGGLNNQHVKVNVIYEDRENILWIGTEGEGLALLKEGKFQYYTPKEGLSSDSVLSIFQDEEGDLWIGTLDGGVCQLRAGRFTVYTTLEGLPHNFITAVYEDVQGNLWVGSSGGVAKLRDNSITAYTTKNGLPANGGSSITQDRNGDLWVTAKGKLCRFRDGRFTEQHIKNGQAVNSHISTLLGDKAGNLWIGTRGTGLNRFRDGQFTLFTTQQGLADNDVFSLYEDREGSIWIGTITGGISRYKDGKFTTWSTKDGLASNTVLSFYEDRRGSLWIGTNDKGLSRFRDGKFTTIDIHNGLYDNLIFQMLSDTDDDAGYLWMSCNKGISRVSFRELDDFVEGRIQQVTSFVYGVADGMLSRECNGADPGGWKTRDGRLWFPTNKGLVAIDPKLRATRPPLINIEQVTVDRSPFSASELVKIQPGQETLEIQYTALSWSRPKQVKFKYQLEGLDHSWIEVGSRRVAYYSHIPPGAYTFRVMADNGEGVWNTEGKSLQITVLPPFYQTWWFTLLIALGTAALVWTAWKYRVAQLQRVQVVQQTFSRQLLDSQESERKRIAAELHDSLGQHLVVIKNLAMMILQAPTRLENSRQQLEDISSEASHAIGEVREISYNLRPHQLDRMGLTKTIESLVKTASSASGITFNVEIDGIDEAFAKQSEINFYRIVQECINNIVKHSGATAAEVKIRRTGKRLSLTIQDNGKGFLPGQTIADTRPGGFGLLGISERAYLLRGKPSIQSTPGRGTTISIIIDLAG